MMTLHPRMTRALLDVAHVGRSTRLLFIAVLPGRGYRSALFDML
jgi:hypothetical protein